MKQPKDCNQNPRQELDGTHTGKQRNFRKTGSKAGLPLNPAAVFSGKASRPQEPTTKSLLWYYKTQMSQFLPIKAPPDWNEEKDRQGYIEIWGVSDNYFREVQELMKMDVARVHEALAAGIRYCSPKHGTYPATRPASRTVGTGLHDNGGASRVHVA